MRAHEYQSPVGWDTHPDDVAPGCLYYEPDERDAYGRRVYCYGTVGRDREGQPHLEKRSMEISDRWYPR